MLRTERLLLRRVRLDDAEALAARRNDPEVAEFQAWALPYPVERARTIVEEVSAMDGPLNEQWWMLIIADHDDTATYGDFVVRLSWEGRTAEIGYTLARDAWGKGYASEAATAVVEYLFETVGVTRVDAMLHPDNPASAMVLERTGLTWEGHLKSSFWVGDENSDDWVYGMTRADWEAWRNRPRTRPDDVRLVEITPETQRAVRALVTHKSQERFVSPVINSFADASFPESIDGAPVVPWMRAVEADGEPVGFVLMAMITDAHPEPYLWRFVIDRMHQRRGIGATVIDLLVEQCRAWGADSLVVSWRPGRGSPEPMYLSRGFVPTGVIEDGEIEARLRF